MLPRIGRHRTIMVLSMFTCSAIFMWYILFDVSDIDQTRAISAVQSALKTLDSNPSMLPEVDVAAAHASHLVMVPGHAIWRGGSAQGRSASEWVVADFQRGQTDTFIKHIQTAARIARNDPNAILVFSGGQTSLAAGPLSEGQSYWLLAEVLGELIPDTNGNSLKGRMISEEFARDSYENLLFSIARFKEYTDRYPTRITVVGLEFKQPRFTNLHRAILHFPLEHFRYFGIDPPQLKDNPPTQGEAANAGIPFSEDPHGCFNKILVSKRRERNPFHRTHPYTFSCPELYNLLTICNRNNVPESVYYSLPWGQASLPISETIVNPSTETPAPTEQGANTVPSPNTNEEPDRKGSIDTADSLDTKDNSDAKDSSDINEAIHEFQSSSEPTETKSTSASSPSAASPLSSNAAN